MASRIQNDRALDTIVATVRREYHELPGLILTVDQARRLWALEPPVCLAVLRRLVDAGELTETDTGRFTRPTAA